MAAMREPPPSHFGRPSHGAVAARASNGLQASLRAFSSDLVTSVGLNSENGGIRGGLEEFMGSLLAPWIVLGLFS
eukprot:4670161-Pyramimonas_sp.AAC.1